MQSFVGRQLSFLNNAQLLVQSYLTDKEAFGLFRHLLFHQSYLFRKGLMLLGSLFSFARGGGGTSKELPEVESLVFLHCLIR